MPRHCPLNITMIQCYEVKKSIAACPLPRSCSHLIFPTPQYLGGNRIRASRRRRDKVDRPVNNEIGLRPARADRILDRSGVGINRDIGQRTGVECILARRASVDGETVQINVGLVDEVAGSEAVCDSHTARGAGDGGPGADIDGVVDVVATGANVQDAADASLQLGQSGCLIPAPAVAAVAGLGVERDRIALLVAEGGSEVACPGRRGSGGCGGCRGGR